MIDVVKYKVTIDVIDIQGEGNCSIEQKVGDTYNYPEDKGKMCSSSFYVLFPWIMVMESGGKFYGSEEDHLTLGCPDYRHQVVYKISRKVVEE